MGTFAGIYFNIIFKADTVIQQVVLSTIQIFCLVTRLTYAMPGMGEWQINYDLPFILISIAVLSLISANQTTDFKYAFEQKFKIEKQKVDFEEMLNSFPDAVLIAGANRDAAESNRDLLDDSAWSSLGEERPRSRRNRPVVLPTVKFVNSKFNEFFDTESTGLNTFLASKVFHESNLTKDDFTKAA